MATNKQRWLQEKNKNSLISIRNNRYTVYSPLPDEFGMTVGSEFSEPFDTGSMSETWQKAFAVGGISNKFGLRMKKMFTNPEPTEISFDMEFVAYYNARDEVFMPVVYLTVMALGSELEWDNVEDKTKELAELVSNTAGGISDIIGTSASDVASSTQSDEANKYGGKLLDLIGLVQSPEQVTVKFGNIMKWKNMYITSVSPRFSNNLDSGGFPMSATVSVTVTPEQYPIANEMVSVFGNPRETRNV